MILKAKDLNGVIINSNEAVDENIYYDLKTNHPLVVSGNINNRIFKEYNPDMPQNENPHHYRKKMNLLDKSGSFTYDEMLLMYDHNGVLKLEFLPVTKKVAKQENEVRFLNSKKIVDTLLTFKDGTQVIVEINNKNKKNKKDLLLFKEIGITVVEITIYKNKEVNRETIFNSLENKYEYIVNSFSEINTFLNSTVPNQNQLCELEIKMSNSSTPYLKRFMVDEEMFSRTYFRPDYYFEDLKNEKEIKYIFNLKLLSFFICESMGLTWHENYSYLSNFNIPLRLSNENIYNESLEILEKIELNLNIVQAIYLHYKLKNENLLELSTPISLALLTGTFQTGMEGEIKSVKIMIGDYKLKIK